MSNVATVITELAEKLAPEKLVAAAEICGEITIAQRLGYLLDRFADKEITAELHSWVNERKLNPTLLRPNWNSDKTERDTKWNLIVNEEVEYDVYDSRRSPNHTRTI